MKISFPKSIEVDSRFSIGGAFSCIANNVKGDLDQKKIINFKEKMIVNVNQKMEVNLGDKIDKIMINRRKKTITK